MNMETVKKIMRIAAWVLVLGGVVTLFSFAQKKEDDMLCRQMVIRIDRDPLNENFLVEEDHIRSLIASQFGQVENVPLKNIDVYFLERLLYTNPWVSKAEVYMSIQGTVEIEIEQRQPILRIIREEGDSYYMDAAGRLMPWSGDYTPRVLLASGRISEKWEDWKQHSMEEIINNDTLKTQTLLDDFYSMAQFILADEFWSAQVEQIYVNQMGEMELIPKAGEHRILFGTSDQMAEKFSNLRALYEEGLNHTGWEQYDTLNLKYRNQVVCTKKNFKPALKQNIHTSTH